MENIIIDNLWKTIVHKGEADFEFKRINSICVPELHIGLNSISNRCLILELPTNYKLEFQANKKENLSIEYFKNTNYIVIELNDNNYFDLFNDLIFSIYQKIYLMKNVDDYCQEFIHTYYKWSQFFTELKSDKLSIDIIKGLFGELLILKSMILESNNLNINNTLNSWIGPYDKGHDFILNEKDIEVKTKDLSKLEISISSEFQLDNENGKSLELIVISVEIDLVNGFSIKDLVLEIKEIVNKKLGDNSILIKALNQKGLTLSNMYIYDNFRFNPIESTTYLCDSNEFPKLIRSKTPKEIHGISYCLKTNKLDNFIIASKIYKNGN